MGRGRGRGRFRGGGRGGGRARADDDSDEEYEPQVAGRQNANVGMLPPSDSDEDEDEEGQVVEKKEKQPAKAETGQSKTAGLLPPSDSDEDEDESSEDDAPMPEYLTQPSQRKKKEETQERTAEEVRKDLERLELIRKRREDDRLKRIKDEGWDRYAPVSDTNRPPGTVPTDHPSHKS